MVFDIATGIMGTACFWYFTRGLLKPRHGKEWDELFLSAGFFLLDIAIGNIGYSLPFMACIWGMMMIAYAGDWKVKLFLVVSYFTVRELVRFTIYHAFTVFFGGQVDRLTEKLLFGGASIELLQERLQMIETVYTVSFVSFFVLLLFLFLYFYKKQLLDGLGHVEGNETELLYLMVSTLVGFVYCAIIRSIQFVWEDGEVWILDKQFPIVRLLIPLGSILCLGAVFLAALLLKRVKDAIEKQKENQIYQNRLYDMEKYIRDMELMYADVRSMRHDLKNYVADMQILAQSGEEADKKAFSEYLRALKDRVEELDFAFRTGNPITDVVINRQFGNAAKKGIVTESAFMYPAKEAVEAFDISILLNNALENAVEACPEGGSISLSSKRQGKLYLISVQNTCEHDIFWEDGLPVSSKTGALHGQGIKNMQKIAEKYGGTVHARLGNQIFYLEILLQTGNINSL